MSWWPARVDALRELMFGTASITQSAAPRLRRSQRERAGPWPGRLGGSTSRCTAAKPVIEAQYALVREALDQRRQRRPGRTARLTAATRSAAVPRIPRRQGAGRSSLHRAAGGCSRCSTARTPGTSTCPRFGPLDGADVLASIRLRRELYDRHGPPLRRGDRAAAALRAAHQPCRLRHARRAGGDPRGLRRLQRDGRRPGERPATRSTGRTSRAWTSSPTSSTSVTTPSGG